MTEAIRNGLYSITTTLLDGVHGGQTGVSVLRNGTMLGVPACCHTGPPTEPHWRRELIQ